MRLTFGNLKRLGNGLFDHSDKLRREQIETICHQVYVTAFTAVRSQ